MAKKKKILAEPKQKNPTKPTQGVVERVGVFKVKSIRQPNGQHAVDIDCLDSQVRTGYGIEMFDTVFHMMKMRIQDQCENLKESIGDAITYRESKDIEKMRLQLENDKLKKRLVEVKRIALNIKVGIGSTPATPAKETKLKLFSAINKK